MRCLQTVQDSRNALENRFTSLRCIFHSFPHPSALSVFFLFALLYLSRFLLSLSIFLSLYFCLFLSFFMSSSPSPPLSLPLCSTSPFSSNCLFPCSSFVSSSPSDDLAILTSAPNRNMPFHSSPSWRTHVIFSRIHFHSFACCVFLTHANWHSRDVNENTGFLNIHIIFNVFFFLLSCLAFLPHSTLHVRIAASPLQQSLVLVFLHWKATIVACFTGVRVV